MSKNMLSNKPPKGTSDWFPEEYSIRKYIFDTWRRVNVQFGYQEYLTPILETADIYRAKSGEDVGGKELLVIEDRGGRELAMRPEMTPSVTRMVSRTYMQEPKPMRLFSIANFWRNERPQRGRNREFWQLNTDIFGSVSLNADWRFCRLPWKSCWPLTRPKRLSSSTSITAT
jgi:histidyl-tRNA synthetase